MSSIQKYANKVYSFLEERRANEIDKVTHLSYGKFNGKFSVSDEDYEEFMKLYINAIEKGVNDFSILERPKEYGPIIVDIDLQLISNDKTSRLYNNQLIENIIKKYVSVIKNCLYIKKDYNIALFEKPKPTEKEGDKLKDGFHLLFPDLCLDSITRHYIREQVIELCKNDDTFKDYNNTVEEIIDKAVISSNSWFLYGSCKPNYQPYSLTKIYNSKKKIIYDHINKVCYDPDTGKTEDGENTVDNLIRYFSIQQKRYRKKKETKLLDTIKEEIQKKDEKDIKKDYNWEDKDTNILFYNAQKLTNILSIDRASNYNNWIEVGFCLHNINKGLLNVWIEFSKKCPSKYKEGECEALWKSFAFKKDNGLNYGSLAYWAKCDDPETYNELIKEFKNNNNKILDTDKFKQVFLFGTEIDRSNYIGDVLDGRLKVYINTLVKNSKPDYYLFDNETKLYKQIQEDQLLNTIIKMLLDTLSKIKIPTDEEIKNAKNSLEEEALRQTRDLIRGLKHKLDDYRYYRNIIKNLASDYNDEKFINLLNVGSPTTLPIKGGKLINLETLEVRDRTKDDFYDFELNVEYNNNKEDRKIEETFLRQLMNNNEDKYNYLKQILGYTLTGLTSAQSFFVFYGSGSNGKSTLFNIMDEILGKFYNQASDDIFIKKNKNASSASPELQILKKSRLVCFCESGENDKFNDALIKKISGGDSIVFRMLFQNDFEKIKTPTKLIMSTNNIPEFDIKDEAFLRRFKYIHFNMKFNQEGANKCDVDIKSKLNNDKIFSLLCEEAKKYIDKESDKSLNPPQIIKDEFNNMIYLKDYTKQFINDMLNKTDIETDTISFSILYTNYKEYCRSNNKEALGRNKFYEDIKAKIKPEYYVGNASEHPMTLIKHKFKTEKETEKENDNIRNNDH